MDNFFTKVVYQGAITVTSELDYYSLKATNDIKSPDLLLIEHVFTDTISVCATAIKENEYLYNILHPRIRTWKESLDRDDAKQKLRSNCFVSKNDTERVSFGNMLSKINHSCQPNCVAFLCGNTVINEFTVKYFAVYSIRNIAKDEEITVSYGNQRGHHNKDDFQCQCNKTASERECVWNIIDKIGVTFQKTEHSYLQTLIDAYEKTEDARNIMFHQYQANHGCYITGVKNANNRICLTPRYMDFVNKKFKMGNQQDRICKMFNYVEEMFSL